MCWNAIFEWVNWEKIKRQAWITLHWNWMNGKSLRNKTVNVNLSKLFFFSSFSCVQVEKVRVGNINSQYRIQYSLCATVRVCAFIISRKTDSIIKRIHCVIVCVQMHKRKTNFNSNDITSNVYITQFVFVLLLGRAPFVFFSSFHK